MKKHSCSPSLVLLRHLLVLWHHFFNANPLSLIGFVFSLLPSKSLWQSVSLCSIVFLSSFFPFWEGDECTTWVFIPGARVFFSAFHSASFSYVLWDTKDKTNKSERKQLLWNKRASLFLLSFSASCAYARRIEQERRMLRVEADERWEETDQNNKRKRKEGNLGRDNETNSISSCSARRNNRMYGRMRRDDQTWSKLREKEREKGFQKEGRKGWRVEPCGNDGRWSFRSLENQNERSHLNSNF